MSKLPNFLIVGAAKSGTTSLHYYLSQHPDIFMPSYTKDGKKVKEPRFLVRDLVKDRVHTGVWDEPEYSSLFESAVDFKAVGEATVLYLFYYEEAIKNIKKYLGNEVKIIIILRNPVDRAFSAYNHNVRQSIKENLSFECALEQEEVRFSEDKTLSPMILYKKMGLYYNMVAAYLAAFKYVKIILYDDFLKDANGVVRELFLFLGVDADVVVNTSERKNAESWEWKNGFIKNLVFNRNIFKGVLNFVLTTLPDSGESLKKHLKTLLQQRKRSVLKKETKTLLEKYFESDVENLSKLIGKDLSHWVKVEGAEKLPL